MRLTVKNLGPITNASVDLNKDLIVLTGENNTGKTYLAYLVYDLYTYRNWSQLDLVENYDFIEENGNQDFYLKKILELNHDKILEEIHKKLHHHLFLLFASLPGHFDKTALAIEGLKEQSSNLEGKKFSLNAPIELRPNKNGQIKFEDFTSAILSPIFNECVIFTAERQGISIFSKEITLIKSRLFDTLVSKRDDLRHDILSFAKNVFNRYAIPIQENLRIAQLYDVLEKQVSEFAYLADEFERSLIGGKISVSPIGNLEFNPENTEEKLEIHLTSSTVKSLAPLAFYLRHQAQKGDFIIIDEPEANLHPNNQIKIARFLARLVNEGFKVIVSTHSDYIMRELNSLIMLGTGKKKSPGKTEELCRKFPEYNEKQFLDNKQVGVYLFRQGKDVEELEIREDGFEVATIDETVDRLNETSQNIYYELFD